VFIPLYCKYVTLRYRFDNDGVAMQWGVLFRREVYLTYRRIQDIHLTRNIVQRWMGLASLAVQTASGSATPEMTIEGLLQVEELRDFLYSQMRGAKGEQVGLIRNRLDHDISGPGELATAERNPHQDLGQLANIQTDEALELLRQIRDGLAARLPHLGHSAEASPAANPSVPESRS
jgi:uncharacterized membrane protein YdbT with pleckstrin-like domain